MKKKALIFLMISMTALATACGKPDKDVSEVYSDIVSDTNKTDAGSDELSDDLSWEKYPEDNIFGLLGIAKSEDNGVTTAVFAFKHIEKTGINTDSIIKNYEYVSGMCPYGYFDFDDCEVTEKGNFYYVTVSYDSRIDLSVIMFDKQSERCNIGIKDKLELTYCDFRDYDESKWTNQLYDYNKQAWKDSSERSEIRPVDADFGYVSYSEINVDNSKYESSSQYGTVTFSAYDYQYINADYNLYGEIEQAACTELKFTLIDPENITTKQDTFKLYRSEGSEFKDITPDDLTVDAESNYVTDEDGDLMEHYLRVNVSSNSLGELPVGDYRAEYGEYTVDFRLDEIYVEEW